MDLSEFQQEYIEDIKKVLDYQNKLYEDNFASEFSEIKNLSDLLKKNGYKSPSDEVLEMVLLDIPLKLFDVSEKLHQFETILQLLKLNLKEKKLKSKDHGQIADEDSNMQTKSFQLSLIEDELMISVYSKLIDRVNSQISFSKELIMGVKKIWDRRKDVESAMPVAPVDPAAIPYDPNESKKRPIYG